MALDYLQKCTAAYGGIVLCQCKQGPADLRLLSPSPQPLHLFQGRVLCGGGRQQAMMKLGVLRLSKNM